MRKVIPWYDRVVMAIRVTVRFGDGTGRLHVYSPFGKCHGWRKYIGWRILMFGAWVMMGHRKEWTVYNNCEMEGWK